MTQQLNMERDDNGELNIRTETAEQALLRAPEAQRLENAKVMCLSCRKEAPLRRNENGSWTHSDKTLMKRDFTKKCAAAPIWERAYGKK